MLYDMALTIPQIEPVEIIKGTTIKWTKSFPDFLPTEYTITYYIANLEYDMSVAATDNGDDTHAVTISATASDRMTPGEYSYQAKAVLGDEVYIAGSGRITVSEGYTADEHPDIRTDNEKTRDSLRSALDSNITGGFVEIWYSDGKRLVKHDIKVLSELYETYQAKVAAEKVARDIANGVPVKSRQTRIRFT